MTLFTPYTIYGTATDSNGNALVGININLKNESSGEIISTTSNSLGQYSLNAADFASGWLNGDKLTLYTDTPTFEFYVSHNGGLSWYQVENEEDYAFDINSLKVKIDKTNYSGGRELTIIYPV